MGSMNKQTWPEKYDINNLISIQEDIDKIVKGKKSSVRRNDRYADPGDHIKLNGRSFIVENVYPQKLGDVTDKNAKEEGYENLEAYKKGITNIHQEAVWDPDIEVWAHELRPA